MPTKETLVVSLKEAVEDLDSKIAAYKILSAQPTSNLKKMSIEKVIDQFSTDMKEVRAILSKAVDIL
jgi:hypothetical protein